MQLNISDMPIISKATRERWPMSSQVREKVITVCQQALNSADPALQQKAVSNLARLDALNLGHEKIFTPKLDVTLDLSSLSEEEINKRLALLSQHLAAVQPTAALPDYSPDVENKEVAARLAAEERNENAERSGESSS